MFKLQRIDHYTINYLIIKQVIAKITDVNLIVEI